MFYVPETKGAAWVENRELAKLKNQFLSSLIEVIKMNLIESAWADKLSKVK